MGVVIAQIDLVDLYAVKPKSDERKCICVLCSNMAAKILQLSNKKNRVRLLKIRDCGLFPGLEKFSDEEMHKLFFEDLSLIYVAGNEDIGWTHDHLREYAAAKFHTNSDQRFNEILHEVFWNEAKRNVDNDTVGEFRDGFKTQGRKGRYSLFSEGKYSLLSGDFFEIEKVVAEEIMASRPYFSKACESQIKDQMNDGFESVNILQSLMPVMKLGLSIGKGIDIHPLEFSRLDSIDLENVSINLNTEYKQVHDVNEMIKQAFVAIVKYFNSKDINWILDVKSESETRTYLELITGGIIGPLAEKILTVEERRQLFLPVFEDLNNVNNELDSETIKACYFQKFINSSDNYNFEIYKKYLGHDYFSKGDYLDKNNLNVKSNFMEKMKRYYSAKNSKYNSKMLFTQINKIAEPLASSEMKVLKYKLNNLELESKEKLAHYEKMAHVYYMEGNTKESLSAHEKALEIAKKLNLIEKQAEILMEIGDITIEIGDLDYAEKALTECLELSEKLGKEEHIGTLLVDLGYVYFMRGDEKNAHKYYLSGLEVNEKVENLIGVFSSYTNLATISYNRGQNDYSEKYLIEAYKIGNKISENHECDAILRLAYLYRKSGKYDMAEQIISTTNKFYEIVPINRAKLSKIQGNIAVDKLNKFYYNKTANYDKIAELENEALHNYLNAFQIVETLGDVVNLMSLCYDLGFLYEFSKCLSEPRWNAQDWFRKCLDLSLKLDDIPMIIDSAIGYADNLTDGIDSEEKYKHYKLALDLGHTQENMSREQKNSLEHSLVGALRNLEIIKNRKQEELYHTVYDDSSAKKQLDVITKEIQDLRTRYSDYLNPQVDNNHNRGIEKVNSEVRYIMPEQIIARNKYLNKESKKEQAKVKKNEVSLNLTSTFFKDLLMNNNPIYIDVLDLTFFGRMSKVEDLLNGYRTLPDQPSPISIVTTLHKDGNSLLIVDGRRFFITLYAAFIKSSELSKEHDKILDSFLEVYFLDNTDRGKFVDMINNPQDFGEDVELFVANIEQFLAKFDDIDELIRCILRTPIRMTSVDDDDWIVV